MTTEPSQTSGVTTAALFSFLAAAALPICAGAVEPPGALARAGEALVARLVVGQNEPGLVALVVSSPGVPELAAPLETAIVEALGRHGYSAAPLSGTDLTDPPAAARKLGADRLLRVSAGLVPGRTSISLSAEDLPTRQSFFLQHAPQVRPGHGRLWSFELPADPAILMLARASTRPAISSTSCHLRPLWRLSDRVLALAAGDPSGDGSLAVVVVSSTALSLHGPRGELLAQRKLEPFDRVRRPAAAVAVGDFSGGRIALQLAGGKLGDVISLRDGVLRPVAPLAAAPLAATGNQRVFGAFLPARATFADLFSSSPEVGAVVRSSRELVSFAAAPHPGRIAYAALYGDGLLQLLGSDLTASGSPLTGVGTGFALANLDGDGEPELVSSSAEPGADDRVRVLRLRPSGAEPIFESSPIAGTILAGAAVDFTGDGLDDALLASILPSGESQIWLVTTDPRSGGEEGGAAP